MIHGCIYCAPGQLCPKCGETEQPETIPQLIAGCFERLDQRKRTCSGVVLRGLSEADEIFKPLREAAAAPRDMAEDEDCGFRLTNPAAAGPYGTYYWVCCDPFYAVRNGYKCPQCGREAAAAPRRVQPSALADEIAQLLSAYEAKDHVRVGLMGAVLNERTAYLLREAAAALRVPPDRQQELPTMLTEQDRQTLNRTIIELSRENAALKAQVATLTEELQRLRSSPSPAAETAHEPPNS